MKCVDLIYSLLLEPRILHYCDPLLYQSVPITSLEPPYYETLEWLLGRETSTSVSLLVCRGL